MSRIERTLRSEARNLDAQTGEEVTTAERFARAADLILVRGVPSGHP